jgi:hypothetical protein
MKVLMQVVAIVYSKKEKYIYNSSNLIYIKIIYLRNTLSSPQRQ